MIRKFNYTGRKKIPRVLIPVAIYEMTDGTVQFGTELNIDDLGLPDGASIFIEAYKPMRYYKRFSYGKVGNRIVPSDRDISDAGETEDLLFRVKIVDDTIKTGILVAVADRIAPKLDSKKPSRRKSLLPVVCRDIGDLIWRLSLGEEDHPVLEISSNIDGLSEIIRSDLVFHALVLPEVFRQILRHIFEEEQIFQPYADDDVWHCWLRFSCSLPGITNPPEEDDDDNRRKNQWIEDVVDSFCRTQKYISNYSKHYEIVDLT